MLWVGRGARPDDFLGAGAVPVPQRAAPKLQSRSLAEGCNVPSAPGEEMGKRWRGGGVGTCLSGGEGGGEGVQGGGPPPCQNIPNPQGTEKLLENEQLSTWKCHVVDRKQRKFIIECQFPHLTNTQQLQQSATFTISCQMTVIFLVNQN